MTSVQRLVQVFTQAGLNVRLGSADPAVTGPRALALPDGSELTVEPLLRTRGRLGLKDFDPCTILLNNDLAQGIPRELHNLHEQYLLPPLNAGWTVRRKSRHFQSYEEVAKKFAKLLGMDPWLLHPITQACGAVDLATPQGLEAAQTAVDVLLATVRRKCKDYGIAERPFAVLRGLPRRAALRRAALRPVAPRQAALRRAALRRVAPRRVAPRREVRSARRPAARARSRSSAAATAATRAKACASDRADARASVSAENLTTKARRQRGRCGVDCSPSQLSDDFEQPGRSRNLILEIHYRRSFATSRAALCTSDHE